MTDVLEGDFEGRKIPLGDIVEDGRVIDLLGSQFAHGTEIFLQYCGVERRGSFVSSRYEVHTSLMSADIVREQPLILERRREKESDNISYHVSGTLHFYTEDVTEDLGL